MSHIHRLPPHVINHIAAGEVIEQPVSVVKELIENALDAGASRIEVDLLHGGRERITVSDNGHGIEHTSVPLLFERYATSKFNDLNDFSTLKSLGFRGEALFSIMNAADVTVISRSYREPEGTWIRTHNGKVEEVRPIGCRVGTMFMIDHLFAQFPVRKLTMEVKKNTQQIKQLISRYALAYPAVSFVLKHNNTILLAFFDQEDSVDRIVKHWELPKTQVFELSATHDDWRFTTWLSHPKSFATHKRHQLLVINERPVEMSALHQTIEKSLKTFTHAGKHPQYVFLLEIAPQLLDVNIHPQKLTVTIADQERIFDEICHRLEQALEQILPSELRFSADELFSQSSSETWSVKEPTALYLAGPFIQLDNTFIITPTQDGFLLIDQHAADERLWYNSLLQNKTLLSEVEQEIGIECQQELDDDVYQHSFEREINARIATIACHQAIRAGQKLSQEEMRTLVQDVIDGGNETLVCPHGRPTHIVISKAQLEGVFRRR